MKDVQPRTTARNKMMDYLARRDHSELELRQKLKRLYTPEQIETAINYGKEHGWISKDPNGDQGLAEKTADFLHRKKKGILFINAYLHKKGLPEVESDQELELEKAQYLVKNKYLLSKDLSREDYRKVLAKMSRFLMSRGFATNTIQQIIARGRK